MSKHAKAMRKANNEQVSSDTVSKYSLTVTCKFVKRHLRENGCYWQYFLYVYFLWLTCFKGKLEGKLLEQSLKIYWLLIMTHAL